MSNKLDKVHQINLKMLKEIDRICRKHQISYMMDAGTLLGAVRHKGFIPWDDDADLVFTRDNYEQFMRVAEQELPEDMQLLDYRKLNGGKAFYDFTSRIIYKKSQIHDHTAEMEYYGGSLNHLWVDLFVLDQLPDQIWPAAFVILLQKIVYGMAMGHRYALDYGKYSAPNKVFVAFLAGIGRLIPLKWLFGWQELLAKRYHRKRSRQKYYSNYQPDYLYVRMKHEWCCEIIDMEFAGVKLMAPQGWHQILTMIYGDYRKLPPKDQQVPSHSSIEIQIFD